jgi:hypothetical protein
VPSPSSSAGPRSGGLYGTVVVLAGITALTRGHGDTVVIGMLNVGLGAVMVVLKVLVH